MPPRSDFEPPPSSQRACNAEKETRAWSDETIETIRPPEDEGVWGDFGVAAVAHAGAHDVNGGLVDATHIPVNNSRSSRTSNTQESLALHVPVSSKTTEPSHHPAEKKATNPTHAIKVKSSSLAKPAVVAPQTARFFDPWNSSSTGHQRAENRLSGSTSWRQSRNLKLSEQYKAGLGGGAKRVADTVGAGSEDFGKDGRLENGGWEKGAKVLRGHGQKSLAEIWGASKAVKSSSQEKEQRHLVQREDSVDTGNEEYADTADEQQLERENDVTPRPKQIFENLVFYLNGSTAPLVSDHKLKQLLAERGGKMSIGLGRRSVTHVILGTTNSAGGCGGGLAASKIQKEIARTGGKGVKFVAVDWVLTSIAQNRRQPEARFAPLHLTSKGQNSVYPLFTTSTSKSSSKPPKPSNPTGAPHLP